MKYTDGATSGISSNNNVKSAGFDYSSNTIGGEESKKSLRQNLEENSAWVAYGNMPGGEGGFQMRNDASSLPDTASWSNFG